MQLRRILCTASIVVTALGITQCSSYDDTDVWNALSSQANRIEALEKWQETVNNSIAGLSALVNSNDYIKAVTPVTGSDDIIGYTISFAKQGDIVIYNGTNGSNGEKGEQGEPGEPGASGAMPNIGVTQGEDGLWYWTLNGTILKDKDGNPVCASGKDGKDGNDGKPGANGQPGNDGQPGSDAFVPQLKSGTELGGSYVKDAMYLSVDNGKTWTKVSGDNGKDGEVAQPECVFEKAPELVDDYWVFTLTGGETLRILNYQEFSIFMVDGDAETMITNGKLKVEADKEIVIGFRSNSKETPDVACSLYHGNGTLSTDAGLTDGTVSLGTMLQGERVTVLFAVTYSDNRTVLYKVTVTCPGPTVDTGDNEKLSEAIVEALGETLGDAVGDVYTDEDGNVVLTKEIIDNTTTLDLSGKKLENFDLSALSVFDNLEQLNVSGNDITELKIENEIPNLKTLDISDNGMTDADFTKLPGLTELNISNNNFAELNLEGLTELKVLNCSNSLASTTSYVSRGGVVNGVLDLSDHPKLERLDCSQNNLTELIVTDNELLQVINCAENQLTELDLSKNTQLRILHTWNNQLTSIDLSNNTSLEDLEASENKIASIDFRNNRDLWTIELNGNQLSEIDVTMCESLEYLNASNNKLTSLNLSNNNRLKELRCSANKLTSLNLYNNVLLTTVACDRNMIEELNIGMLSSLEDINCGYQQNNIKLRLIVNADQMDGVANRFMMSTNDERVIVVPNNKDITGNSSTNFGNGGVY